MDAGIFNYGILGVHGRRFDDIESMYRVSGPLSVRISFSEDDFGRGKGWTRDFQPRKERNLRKWDVMDSSPDSVSSVSSVVDPLIGWRFCCSGYFEYSVVRKFFFL
jgi:hypothetical protein